MAFSGIVVGICIAEEGTDGIVVVAVAAIKENVCENSIEFLPFILCVNLTLIWGKLIIFKLIN
jgi:hypothetical protein